MIWPARYLTCLNLRHDEVSSFDALILGRLSACAPLPCGYAHRMGMIRSPQAVGIVRASERGKAMDERHLPSGTGRD